MSRTQLTFKQEAGASPEPGFQLESWESISDEVLWLAERHFTEVDGGVEPRRRFEIDQQLMAYGCRIGAIKIYTVRVSGVLAGYCTWNLSYDIESKGLLVATQGAWYTDQEFAGHGLGLKLFKWTLDELRLLGVKCVFPHHRTQGRGTEDRLGTFLVRMGAKLTQYTYTLWIGED